MHSEATGSVGLSARGVTAVPGLDFSTADSHRSTRSHRAAQNEQESDGPFQRRSPKRKVDHRQMPTPKNSLLARAIEFAVVVASNDASVLNNSLMRSPEIQSVKEVVIRQNFSSAAQAYNSGIDASKAEFIVFAHQNVFFPDG